MIQTILSFQAIPVVRVYFWIATALAIYFLMKMPRDTSREYVPAVSPAVDHAGGAIVAGVCFGWIAWPFILAAYLIKRRGAKAR